MGLVSSIERNNKIICKGRASA